MIWEYFNSRHIQSYRSIYFLESQKHLLVRTSGDLLFQAGLSPNGGRPALPFPGWVSALQLMKSIKGGDFHHLPGKPGPMPCHIPCGNVSPQQTEPLKVHLWLLSLSLHHLPILRGEQIPCLLCWPLHWLNTARNLQTPSLIQCGMFIALCNMIRKEKALIFFSSVNSLPFSKVLKSFSGSSFNQTLNTLIYIYYIYTFFI